MNVHDALKTTLQTTNMVLHSYVGDLSDSELLTRPHPECNHIAWQLGHLIDSNSSLLNAVKPGAAPKLPEGFSEKHSKANIGSNNAADFLSKDAYMKLFAELDAAVIATIDSLTEADLDQPSPPAWKDWFPTLGNLMVLIVTHSLMHAGQWVPARRMLGKPVVI